MPELPDIVVYQHAIEHRLKGQVLQNVRLLNPFVLRSVAPPLAALAGQRLIGVERLGKRIVLAFDGDLYAVLHLMIAGRLRWFAPGAKPPGKLTLAAFEFGSGTLAFTEAGSKRRASLHVVQGREALAAHDMGGIDVMSASLAEFSAVLRRENHTLKRALTDPGSFSGIGNAYSDEILHCAKLSPIALTQKLSDEQIARLHAAARKTLAEWTARLLALAGDDFPEGVTAFRPEMAVHGRFGKPCPVCGAPVQRIVYAENETNYCARCQTGGAVLADRALSRLLKQSWPRALDEMQ